MLCGVFGKFPHALLCEMSSCIYVKIPPTREKSAFSICIYVSICSGRDMSTYPQSYPHVDKLSTACGKRIKIVYSVEVFRVKKYPVCQMTTHGVFRLVSYTATATSTSHITTTATATPNARATARDTFTRRLHTRHNRALSVTCHTLPEGMTSLRQAASQHARITCQPCR